jgi:hypothetical protein
VTKDSPAPTAAGQEPARRNASAPLTINDLLKNYDAEKIKRLTREFLDMPPQGKETF